MRESTIGDSYQVKARKEDDLNSSCHSYSKIMADDLRKGKAVAYEAL